LPNAAVAFGTGDFTLEGWFYVLQLPASGTNILDIRNGGTSIAPLLDTGPTDTTLRLYVNGAGFLVSSTIWTINTWHHFALSRASANSRLFLDGTQIGSTTADSNSYVQNGFEVGNSNFANAFSSAPIYGYFQEIRITKGVGRYTANFSPPSTRFSDN
jgi:hypothetical protein